MDLLNIINNCSEEELKQIIDNALEQIDKNDDVEKTLGFAENMTAISKMPVHKGFITSNMRIRFSNGSMFSYSMKTKDYFYDFAKYIKHNNITTTADLVKFVENFINYYFGKPNGIDNRDNYFNNLTLDTKTDEEYFDAINNFSIGDLKGKNLAMCTERSAIAQNLLSLFGLEVYYCMGCVEHNGEQEPHCFNIARGREKYILLDYSLPVSIYKNNVAYDYVPFQAHIELDELEDVLENGLNKNYDGYEFINIADRIKKIPNDDYRIYQVGKMHFEKNKQI